MSLLQAAILGILQGITEFLPISSSGHLVLGETILGLQVAELKDFDVVVHVGTLLAILVYFWRSLIQPKYWFWLILGTLPAVIIGFTLADQIDAIFRNTVGVAISMMLVGAMFLIPEKFAIEKKENQRFVWWKVLIIGMAQAVALIPGVSRSGSTIFTGTFLGMKREEAARFSFMLGAIAIAGAGLLTALDLRQFSLSINTLSIGFIAAFLSSLTTVILFMRYLKTHSLRIFGVYLITIGTIALLVSI